MNYETPCLLGRNSSRRGWCNNLEQIGSGSSWTIPGEVAGCHQGKPTMWKTNWETHSEYIYIHTRMIIYVYICIYIYICMYICIYVYMYICIYVYMYICIYVYMYICIYVYMYICIYVYMYICIYVYMYICIYVYMYICIYVYMYICIYVYMYICIYIIYVYMYIYYICIHVYMYTCIHVYMYIYIYVYMYICIYVYMYICIYVYMYICIYVYMYICIYVYMYIWNTQNRKNKKLVPQFHCFLQLCDEFRCENCEPRKVTHWAKLSKLIQRRHFIRSSKAAWLISQFLKFSATWWVGEWLVRHHGDITGWYMFANTR